ncbi:hypothetical protein D3C87_669870 [compost metagenome]
MNKKIFIIALTLIFLGTVNAFSQTKTWKFTVISRCDDQGIPSASVIQIGTTNAVLTDIDGIAYLTVPDDNTTIQVGIGVIGYTGQNAFIPGTYGNNSHFQIYFNCPDGESLDFKSLKYPYLEKVKKVDISEWIGKKH